MLSNNQERVRFISYRKWPSDLCRFAVPEQPTNLQGESVSPNAVQLSWDPPEDSGESIQSYELYFNDSHFRQNVRITISPPRNTYLLEDLTPNTVYHIRVAAKSMRGEGASTSTIQVRTLEYGEYKLQGSFPLSSAYK